MKTICNIYEKNYIYVKSEIYSKELGHVIRRLGSFMIYHL